MFSLAAERQAEAPILSGRINDAQKLSEMSLVMSVDSKCLWAHALLFRLYLILDHVLNLAMCYTKSLVVGINWGIN